MVRNHYICLSSKFRNVKGKNTLYEQCDLLSAMMISVCEFLKQLKQIMKLYGVEMLKNAMAV